jgi:DNA replication protein DnaC
MSRQAAATDPRQVPGWLHAAVWGAARGKQPHQVTTIAAALLFSITFTVAAPADIFWRPTRSTGVTCRDRDEPAAVAGRSDRGAEAAEDGRDAPTRPRAAGDREDPTMEARGVPPNAGRGRDRRQGRLERPDRLRQAAFPVTKTLAEFDVATSSIPAATFDYLASLEWIRATENLCLIGPAGTGKGHILVALGHAAVEAGHRVRYFTAAELVETLYRGLADNSVGRVIDTLLRNDLVIVDELGFAPLDDTGAQLLFRFIAAAYERRSLGIGSHWPFESWGRFLPEHTTAVSMLDRLLHHCHTVVTDGDSYRMKQARANGGTRIKTS